MVTQYAHNWWWLALRGLAAIIFGILALIWPGITFEVLVLFFGAYVLLDGVFAVISALTHRTAGDHRWLLLLEGIVGIAVGVLTFLMPGVTAVALIYLVAAWGVITGLLEILAAIRLRREMSNEWLLALSGIVSVVFGLIVAAFPAVGALAIVWLIGVYAIIFGVLELVLAFRLRGAARAGQPMTGTPA